ncbi:hypothetical protein Hanom_Chr04g00326721 [Helianthus anomalus]
METAEVAGRPHPRQTWVIDHDLTTVRARDGDRDERETEEENGVGEVPITGNAAHGGGEPHRFMLLDTL